MIRGSSKQCVPVILNIIGSPPFRSLLWSIWCLPPPLLPVWVNISSVGGYGVIVQQYPSYVAPVMVNLSSFEGCNATLHPVVVNTISRQSSRVHLLCSSIQKQLPGPPCTIVYSKRLIFNENWVVPLLHCHWHIILCAMHNVHCHWNTPSHFAWAARTRTRNLLHTSVLWWFEEHGITERRLLFQRPCGCYHR